MIQLRDRHIEELIPQYLERLNINSEDVEALYELGRISVSLGRVEEATSFLARVVALEPWRAEAKGLLLELRSKAGRMELDEVVALTRNALSKSHKKNVNIHTEAASEPASSDTAKNCNVPSPKIVAHDANHLPLSILYIPLEFSTWNGARSWSYSAQLGLEEGFAANNLECLTIPVIQGIPSHFPASWLSHAKQLCVGRRFDQVWIELVHTDPGEEVLEWLATLAPVRIALLPESLEFDDEIYSLHPPLRNRKAVVDFRLRFMTHALAVDEVDAERLNRGGLVKALWWPQAVPERFIRVQSGSASAEQAIFGGASYSWRQRIMDYPPLARLLKKLPAPENDTSYPALFDAVNRHCLAALDSGRAVDETMLAAYLSVLRGIRQECFSLWLNSLGSGCAVVNLPGYIKSYPGRVIEGMAAGRPVVSAEVPDRPRTRELFCNGEDILLFPQERPEVLEQHIIKLRSDPDYARQLAENARAKLWRFHTMEKRIGQILDWIQGGTEPCYHEQKNQVEIDAALQKFQASFSFAGPISVQQAAPGNTNLEKYTGMVSAAIEQRDIAKAITLLEQVIHLEPQFSEMLLTLCSANHEFGKAALYSLVAIANNKPNVDLLIAACEIAEKLNNKASGSAFMREAFRLNPSGSQLERLLKFDFGQDWIV